MEWQQMELFERWLPVVGYEGLYEVSDWGRVRSLPRLTRSNHRIAGRLLTLSVREGGYLYASLLKDGKLRIFSAHRLVAEVFLGSRPPGKCVDHIDGNRTHNSLKNLRYVTHKENNLAAVPRRVMPKGENHWNAKLKPEQVIEIRRLHIEGMSMASIAKVFPVNERTVRKIIRSEKWPTQ